MKNFNDIERIFDREKRPYWILLDAKGRRVSCTTDAIMQSADAEERLTASFAHLETVMEEEGDGVYKIQLRTSANSGRNQFEHTFQYGDPVAEQTTAKGKETKSGNTGIFGLNSIHGLEFISGLLNNGRGEADRLREEKNELKLDLLRRDFEISGLTAQLAGASSGGNDWSDLIKGVVQDHFEVILDKFIPEENRPVIAALRSKKPIELPKKRQVATASRHVPTSGSPNPPNTEGGNGADFKARFKTVLGEFAEFFPDDNPVETLERLPFVFDDIKALFPDEDPITVIEVAVEMIGSKTGRKMVLPILQEKLNALAEAEGNGDDDVNKEVEAEEADYFD